MNSVLKNIVWASLSIAVMVFAIAFLILVLRVSIGDIEMEDIKAVVTLLEEAIRK